jgi:hypothetical protein
VDARPFRQFTIPFIHSGTGRIAEVVGYLENREVVIDVVLAFPELVETSVRASSHNAAHVALGRTRKETGLISTTPLAFELVCKGTVLKTLGDAIRLYGELTPEQREEYSWRVAIHTLNSAIKEPRYLTAATITLQTALNLSGMLAEPPEGP